MHLPCLLLCLCLGGLAVATGGGSDWCYHGCVHTPSYWRDIPGAFCGGKWQSPVNIVTGQVVTDAKLENFTLDNFSNRHVLKTLTNTGHTVKCDLEEKQVAVSGGGLNGSYSAVQFHFHWGGESQYHPGSEHTVDGHRYPMEMHIVSLKEGLTVVEALADPEGISVLGFFIDATEGASSQPWEDFTSYLTNLNSKGSWVKMTHNISLSDLIGDVDLTKFYRYRGSLTTPTCNQAVVWTVFPEPIRVSNTLIERFPSQTGLTNVFRPLQRLNGRLILASPAVHSTATDGSAD